MFFLFGCLIFNNCTITFSWVWLSLQNYHLWTFCLVLTKIKEKETILIFACRYLGFYHISVSSVKWVLETGRVHLRLRLDFFFHKQKVVREITHTYPTLNLVGLCQKPELRQESRETHLVLRNVGISIKFPLKFVHVTPFSFLCKYSFFNSLLLNILVCSVCF